MKTYNEKGFTLIESLVTSIVSTVVGGALFSLMFLYTNKANESISSFLMQLQYDNASSQIAIDVRRAAFVLKEGETPLAHGNAADTVRTIVLWDAAGNSFAKYKFENNKVLQGMASTPLVVGGDPININTGNSYFVIGKLRKDVRLGFSIYKKIGQSSYALSPRKDVLVCRN